VASGDSSISSLLLSSVNSTQIDFVDINITKASCGEDKAGRRTIDRGKRDINRSVALDADGIPLRTAAKRGLVGQQRACSEALEGDRPERLLAKKHTRRRLGASGNGCTKKRAEHIVR
jgi:hypothetical protein